MNWSYHSSSRSGAWSVASRACTCVALFITLLFSHVPASTVIRVPDDYRAIQQAIDAAVDGDEIIVSLGSYQENIDFSGKNIVLSSTDPTNPFVVTSTIIDGRSSDSVVAFSGTELTTCVLSGFTITNGYAARGGGINGNGTLATVQNNRITSNTAYGWHPNGYGGGLCLCNGTIQNNTVSGNTAGFLGGGLYSCAGAIQNNIVSGNCAYCGGGLYECHGTVENNMISLNSADENGGGLSYCGGTIDNNTIRANSAGWDGGGLEQCGGIIQNNIISDNLVSRNGGGLLCCDGTIQNNVISSNSAAGLLGDGGGLAWCDGTIQNNIIRGNRAYFGGGLSGCNATIQNNTVSGNSAYYGGGLEECNATIVNNTVSGNTAYKTAGGLIWCRGLIINCVIWANSSQLSECSTPFYSCVQDWTSGGRGNISSDPKFANPLADNYHLRPDSPCIDAGNLYYLFAEYLADIDGECRVTGSSVDIGSDEYGSSLDSDGDLLADYDEVAQGSNPCNPDSDGDALRDGVEFLRGTSPLVYDTPSGISIPEACPSVQQGVFMAFPEETVTVLPGIYNENLRLPGRNIVLQSTDPLNDGVVSATIIDGNKLSCVIFFEGIENETSAIRGLTIRNGSARFGGGICGNGTRAAIERNKITDSSAVHCGGGVYMCDGTIQNNTIMGNAASCGGGLYGCHGTIQSNIISYNSATSTHGGALIWCDGIIQNNFISGNSAHGSGGGLSFCQGIVRNNTILRNSAYDDGGGLYGCSGTIEKNTISDNSVGGYGGGLHQCNGTVQNNIFSGNAALFGGGLSDCYGIIQNNAFSANSAYCGGGLFACGNVIRNNIVYGNLANGMYSSGGGLSDCVDATVANCIIWQNVAPNDAQLSRSPMPIYSCIQGWGSGGTGNISSDPQLVDPGNGDFHLKSTSPCIDAGCWIPDLTLDFEGDPRPWNGTSVGCGDGSDYDIGSDEYVGTIPAPYEFQAGAEGWVFSGQISPFIAPNSGTYNGVLWLGTMSNTNCFGYWSSPCNAVMMSPGNLYLARFLVMCWNQPPRLVPTLRLRAVSSNFQQVDWLENSSAGGGESSPDATGRSYDLFFEPPANASSISMAFDVLNFDPSDAVLATVGLDAVNVYVYSVSEMISATTEKHYAFDADVEGWTFSGEVVPFAQLNTGVYSGALHLASQNNTNSFGYWHSPASDVAMSATPTLYRATFSVYSDQTNSSLVPQLRLRVYASNYQITIGKLCTSAGSGDNSPTQTARSYSVYFWSPNSALVPNLQAAFDLLNFSPDDALNGTLSLDDVAIETVVLPWYP